LSLTRTDNLVLLVEDSQTQALRTRLVLEQQGFSVEVCETGALALARAAELEPDMVLLDMHLPDMSGREVARRLKEDPYLSGIPVIFVTEVFRDIADVITGFDLGVDDYLIKPVDDGVLVARIRASLRAKRTQRELGRLARLLMTVNQVGLQLASILDLAVLLPSVARLAYESFGYPGVHVYLREGDQLIPAANEGTIGFPAPLPMDGTSLAARAANAGKMTPFGETDVTLAENPHLAGCRSALVVPFHSGGEISGALEVVSHEPQPFSEMDRVALQTLADLVGIAIHNARLYQQMEHLATRDALTGLLNRRAALTQLGHEYERARRYQNPLSVIVVDFDDFKEINDTHGHAAGDSALKGFANLLGHTLREVDLAGRMGGDEFLVVLPETDSQGALLVAERIRGAAEVRPIRLDSGAEVQMRLSLGVAACLGSVAETVQELLHRADMALYQAKAGGGNQVAADADRR